jgi:hypothetical protein
MKMIGEGGGDAPGQQPDLLIDKPCTIDAAKSYFYATVNIVNGGSLNFIEPADSNSRIDFWASSIIVETRARLTPVRASPMAPAAGY